MSNYVEYDLGDGTTILVLDVQESGGVVKAGRGESITVKAKKKFEEVLKEVRTQSKLLIKEINALDVTEAQIKFGLSTSGELGGAMFIGKVGAGVNYEITLKWSKLPPK